MNVQRIVRFTLGLLIAFVVLPLTAVLLSQGLTIYPHNTIQPVPPRRMPSVADATNTANWESQGPLENVANTSTWQSYTDSDYGFIIEYPMSWFESIHGPDFVLSPADLNENSNAPSISINLLDGYETNPTQIEDILSVQEVSQKVEFEKDCKSTTFATASGYICQIQSPEPQDDIVIYHDGWTFIVIDSVHNTESREVLSSFIFTD
jgi:hypothetical protein